MPSIWYGYAVTDDTVGECLYRQYKQSHATPEAQQAQSVYDWVHYTFNVPYYGTIPAGTGGCTPSRAAAAPEVVQVGITIAEALSAARSVVNDAISGLISGLLDGLSSIGEAISSAIRGMVASVGNWFASVVNGIRDTINSVGSWIAGLIDGIKNVIESAANWIESVYERVSAWLGNVIAGVKDWLTQVIESVGSWVSNVPEAVAQLIKDTIAWATEAISTITSWVGDQLTGLVNALIAAENAVNNSLDLGFKWIGEQILKTIEMLGQALDRMAQSITDALSEMWTVFADTWAPIVSAAGDILNMVWSALKQLSTREGMLEAMRDMMVEAVKLQMLLANTLGKDSIMSGVKGPTGAGAFAGVDPTDVLGTR